MGDLICGYVNEQKVPLIRKKNFGFGTGEGVLAPNPPVVTSMKVGGEKHSVEKCKKMKV